MGAEMVLYLDEYRRAKMATKVIANRYDHEVLCVNWNPALSAVAMISHQHPAELSPALPHDFSKVDIETFLDRVYALATQV